MIASNIIIVNLYSSIVNFTTISFALIHTYMYMYVNPIAKLIKPASAGADNKRGNCTEGFYFLGSFLFWGL